MEINSQTKELFFAQYYGQDVLTIGNARCENIAANWGEPMIFETQFLEIKPLYSISDEDATFIINNYVTTPEGYKVLNVAGFVNIIKRYIENNNLPSGIADYLRSKSFALPWNGITVEQQIAAGWVRLVNQ